MAKIDHEHMTAMGRKIDAERGQAAIIDKRIQDELDKVKNEESNRSLSIAINDGRGLIAVSGFDRQYRPEPPPHRYTFFVTKPGEDDAHVSVVLAVPEIHALIDILEKIIDEE